MIPLLLACAPASSDDPSTRESLPSESGAEDSPQDTEAGAQGRLVVNELVSDNDGFHKADDGMVYDWLELANVGDAALSLSGLYVSDDYDEKELHPLPEISLAPGAFVVLFATGNVDAKGLYTPFRLASAGEAVGLFDGVGEAIDWVVFPPLEEGQGYARLPDGGDFEVVQVPTPGESNRRLSWQFTELVTKEASWAYEDSGTDLGSDWRKPDYDDAAWATGPAPLGYGDSHQATQLSYGANGSDKHPTTYLRHRFALDTAPEKGRLLVDLLVDDGAVIYLNGSELLRKNMPDGETSWGGYANVTVYGEEETSYERFELPIELLVGGENVLAAEAHQVQPSSSDLTFGFSMELERLVEE